MEYSKLPIENIEGLFITLFFKRQILTPCVEVEEKTTLHFPQKNPIFVNFNIEPD